MPKKINIEKSGKPFEVESNQSFVIVGANGSGKSHLGAFIEKNNPESLRISAQRALSIPENIVVRNEKVAWNKMVSGNEKDLNKGYKWHFGHETTSLVDDYAAVLEGIFSRNSNERNQYYERCKEAEAKGLPHPHTTATIVDKIQDIWNTVFPHRCLKFEDNTIKVEGAGINKYSAQYMSDGERVAIYLIGQCLVAPPEITIIIDEPEIHLHKTIMQKLWDKIEEYCSKNTFVYITHDLDFATSRKDATLIWVKSSNCVAEKFIWDLEVLENQENIPENLLIEILGNRKNILFIEGEKNSYDYMLYSQIYPEYYVVPCHNCYKVIELTKAFNAENIQRLHNLSVHGIIDRDYLTDKEIDAYQDKKIYPLNVAEVENLYLLEDIQRIVAEHLALEDIESILTKVNTFLFKSFTDEKENQIVSICEREIQYRLSRFNCQGIDTTDLEQKYQEFVNSISIKDILSTKEKIVNKIISEGKTDELLKIYNRKSLINRVSFIFGLQRDEYPKLVLRLLKTPKRDLIIKALKKNMPIF